MTTSGTGIIIPRTIVTTGTPGITGANRRLFGRMTSANAIAAALLACSLSGCAVVAVTDAVVTVGATAVKVGASAVGAAVDVTRAGVRMVTSSDEKGEKGDKGK